MSAILDDINKELTVEELIDWFVNTLYMVNNQVLQDAAEKLVEKGGNQKSSLFGISGKVLAGIDMDPFLANQLANRLVHGEVSVVAPGNAP